MHLKNRSILDGLGPTDLADVARRMRAIVVFEDRPERSILRLLRAGFRHCFCIVGTHTEWTVCDPLKTRIELVRLSGISEHNLVEHYRCSARRALVGDVAPARGSERIRLRAVSCVEVVKRIVNLDAGYVLTPFQLHRALLAAGFAHHGRIDKAKK